MSCPKTQYLITEYFSEELSAVAREELEGHLVVCEECSSELTLFLNTQNKLSQWKEERVPHWDRGTSLFRQEQASMQNNRRSWMKQWIPTAASFAMFCLVAFNTSISSGENGFSVSFGSNENILRDAQLEERLIQLGDLLQIEQEQNLQELLTGLEEQQANNNLQIMQTILEQTQQMTAENFDQIYSYFEQQRQADLEDVISGYQQLADSDFDTMRSMQQLANFVQYTGDIR